MRFSQSFSPFQLQVLELLGPGNGVLSLLRHSTQIKNEPFTPCSALAHGKETIIILLPMLLEICAQIEQRQRKKFPVNQEQRDEQAPDSSVSVDKRMGGFELVMDQS